MQPSIKLYYRFYSYSDDEFQDFVDAVGEYADVQLYPKAVPAAGASLDLDIVVQYIVASTLSGLLWNSLKMLPQALLIIWNSKVKQCGFPPEIASISLRLEDTEIIFSRRVGEGSPNVVFLSKEVIANFDKIASRVLEQLQQSPFIDAGVERVLVYCRNTEEDETTSLYNSNFRVKLVSGKTFYIYDSDMRQFFPLQDEVSIGTLENAADHLAR